MTSRGSDLWQEAWNGLQAKDQATLPPRPVEPEELLAKVEEQRVEARNATITIAGKTVYLRDLLEKCARWIKKFVEVGDTLVQYDPGHAALPWAGLRVILQISLNNLDKHTAVLEGLQEITHSLLWSKMSEQVLRSVAHNARPELEQYFLNLYRFILVFIARAIRFVGKSSNRLAPGVFSTDTKLRGDLGNIVASRTLIERCSHAMADAASIEQRSRLEAIEREINEINRPLQRVDEKLDSTVQRLADREWNEVLDWISTIPYEKNFNAAVQKLLVGTGDWLFQDTDFVAWMESSRSDMLMLRGSAGSGKSTLASMVIKKLIGSDDTENAPKVLYFYCSRDTSQPDHADFDQIALSLLRQAIHRLEDSPLRLKLLQTFKRRAHVGSLETAVALDFLLQSINASSTTYFVIDGFDECSRHHRPSLFKALQRMIDDSSAVVKILITSRRNHADIESMLHRYPSTNISATSNAVDISFYVKHEVERAIAERRILPAHGCTSDTQKQIEKTLIDGANGMFRWVELQLQYICTLRVESVLLARLGRLPPSLEQIYTDLYDHSLRELGEDQAAIVKRVLSWLLICQREVTTHEFLQLVCSKETPDIKPAELLDICFNLVILDPEQDRFRFSHLSVREYLENEHPDFGTASLHDMAASTCLSMLGRQGHQASVSTMKSYASIYWPHHAETAARETTPRLSENALNRLVFAKSKSLQNWAQDVRINGIQVRKLSPRERKLQRCLAWKDPAASIAAAFGLTGQFASILDRGHREMLFKARSSGGETLIHLASSYGHVEIVRMMLDDGADIEERTSSMRTALHASAMNGHEEVVEELLNAGALMVVHDDQDSTPLSDAARSGQDIVVQMLLDRGSELPPAEHNLDKFYSLQQALAVEQSGTIKLLLMELSRDDLNRADDPWLLDNINRVECAKGHYDIVELLIQKGLRGEPGNRYFRDGLILSAAKGHDDIIKLLLRNEGYADQANYITPLAAAANGGHLSTVELLLDNGVDPNLSSWIGTAMRHATRHGHESVIRCLLEYGADVDHPHSDHRTPLTMAVLRKHMKVVEMLLEYGATTDPPCRLCSLRFHEAYQDARHDIYKILRDHMGRAPYTTEIPIDDLETKEHPLPKVVK